MKILNRMPMSPIPRLATRVPSPSTCRMVFPLSLYLALALRLSLSLSLFLSLSLSLSLSLFLSLLTSLGPRVHDDIVEATESHMHFPTQRLKAFDEELEKQIKEVFFKEDG